MLRLAAGLPLVLGLPRLAWAQEAEDPPGEQGVPPPPETSTTGRPAIDDALFHARALGRPVLLVVVPTSDAAPGGETARGAGAPITALARRQRTARRLHALLVDPDERTRLLLANVVVIVASRAELAAAIPAIAARGAARHSLWLLESARAALTPGATPGARRATLTDVTVLPQTAPPPIARPLEAALDGDEVAAAALLPALLAAVLPPEDAASTEVDAILRPRAELELAALGDRRRGAVERDLLALGADEFGARQAATSRLEGLAEGLAATLTAVALGSPDAEARSRARTLVVESVREVQPVGAAWDRWVGGCGQSDPYQEELSRARCGMAQGGPARRWLRLLTSG